LHCFTINPLISTSSRFLLGACLCLFLITARAAPDSLPAWNDGSSKRTIIDFVQHSTGAGDWQQHQGEVHHTDAAREYAYDRKSHIGQLDKALDEAGQKGWTVVDMKNDWKTVYPFMP